MERKPFEYEIQYTKVADRFLKDHEDIRGQYESAIKELLIGEDPEEEKNPEEDAFEVYEEMCRAEHGLD